MSTQATRRSAVKTDGENNNNSSSSSSNSEAVVKKKDVVRAERTMTDNIMTAIFLALIAGVFYHVRNDTEWLKFVVASLAGVSVVIYVSKISAVAIGNFLSEVVLNTSWTPIEDRRPLKKKQTVKKFKDQAWQLVIHFSMACTETYLIFVEEAEEDGSNFFDNTSLCWFSPGTRKFSDNVQMFYVIQLSIWIVTCFSHRFIEARHKDYYQMYVHHLVTIGLILGSWVYGYIRIGVLVLFIHDTSDVPLDLTKMLNYLKVQGPRGFFLVEIAFVFNLITWAFFRLYMYPKKALYSAIFESPIEMGVSPAEFAGYSISDKFAFMRSMDGYILSNSLLDILLVLHIFWFFLLVRILVKLIAGTKAHSAGEDEYEGQSTDNED